MPLICAMLWWEILDTAEITWKKQRDKLSHKTLNYIFPALKKKKKMFIVHNLIAKSIHLMCHFTQMAGLLNTLS